MQFQKNTSHNHTIPTFRSNCDFKKKDCSTKHVWFLPCALWTLSKNYLHHRNSWKKEVYIFAYISAELGIGNIAIILHQLLHCLFGCFRGILSLSTSKNSMGPNIPDPSFSFVLAAYWPRTWVSTTSQTVLSLFLYYSWRGSDYVFLPSPTLLSFLPASRKAKRDKF